MLRAYRTVHFTADRTHPLHHPPGPLRVVDAVSPLAVRLITYDAYSAQQKTASRGAGVGGQPVKTAIAKVRYGLQLAKHMVVSRTRHFPLQSFTCSEKEKRSSDRYPRIR